MEALNPLQGGLLVGFGGLLFLFVPMLAFWVGRSLADDATLRHLLGLLASLSVITGIYGLVQQFAGFPSWDQRWINTNGYTALNVGNGVIRAFGTFSSAQEYGAFLSIGIVILTARLGSTRRLYLVPHLLGIGVVATALVLESSRTPVVLTVVALGAMGSSASSPSTGRCVIGRDPRCGFAEHNAGSFFSNSSR